MDKLFFERQTKLMLECLPCIFPSPLFALKGGTAINFFVRNMPRLSVDIDLTYLKLDDRKTALENIKNELHQITDKINKNVTGAKAIMKATSKGFASKVIAQRDDLEIKIEPNFVLRGVLFLTKTMAVTDKVSNIFEFSYKVPILSF